MKRHNEYVKLISFVNKLPVWILCLILIVSSCTKSQSGASLINQNDVLWETQSKDFMGTMPIGNGDIGANVWVEKSGDLLLYLGKTDAVDENSINLKLGRIRIKLYPNILADTTAFSQHLSLQDGAIYIKGNKQDSAVSLKLWIDANAPVLQIELNSSHPIHQSIQYETWRSHEYILKAEASDLFKPLKGKQQYPVVIFPDSIMPAEGNRLFFCHHNRKPENDGYMITMTIQGLKDFAESNPHPLMGRTFGGVINGDGFKAVSDQELRTINPVRSNVVSIVIHGEQPSTYTQWKNNVTTLTDSLLKLDRQTSFKAHKQWWTDFWNRSHIHVTYNGNDPGERKQVETLNRAYALTRFLNACGGRGKLPIKYNGSIFTVGNEDNPDYRAWGGPGFWFQNQRLIYWNMLATGDFDLMQPWFKMYKDALPLQKYKNLKYFNHEGAFFYETITFWGANISRQYGPTPFEERECPISENPYVKRYWQNGIEQMLMMTEYYNYTQDETFAKDVLIPHATEIIKFYDLHYPKRDSNGKILFDPAQSLETWHTAVNPVPEIVGLDYTINKILAMPQHLLNADIVNRGRRIVSELPPLPIGQKDGKPILLPAYSYSDRKNLENPELYSVFPYRKYGVGKPDIDIAIHSLENRTFKDPDCWSQDLVQMALLGLSSQAKEYVLSRSDDSKHSKSRFPAFWDAFHDWIPDIDHGGNLLLGLNLMLMQCEGNEILLCPAWSSDWDVDFKLHAPGNTTVAGQVKNGKIKNLVVTPEHRKNDVKIMNCNK